MVVSDVDAIAISVASGNSPFEGMAVCIEVAPAVQEFVQRTLVPCNPRMKYSVLEQGNRQTPHGSALRNISSSIIHDSTVIISRHETSTFHTGHALLTASLFAVHACVLAGIVGPPPAECLAVCGFVVVVIVASRLQQVPMLEMAVSYAHRRDHDNELQPYYVARRNSCMHCTQHREMTVTPHAATVTEPP